MMPEVLSKEKNTSEFFRLKRYVIGKDWKDTLQSTAFPSALVANGRLFEKIIHYNNPEHGKGILKELWFDGVLVIHGQYDFFQSASIKTEFDNNWIKLDYDMSGNQKSTIDSGYPPCVSSDLYYKLKTNNSPKKSSQSIRSEDFVEVYFTAHYFQRIACRDCSLLNKLSKDGVRPEYLRNAGIVITPKMYYVLKEIINCKFTEQAKRLFLESKILELYMLQIEQYRSVCACPFKDAVKDSERDKLNDVRFFLEENLNLHFTLKDVSRYVGLNEFKLKKGFKEIYGKTVFQYLTELRILKARELLLESNLQVSEIGEKVGYKYAHHFVAAFKKEFGLPPGEFKRAHGF